MVKIFITTYQILTLQPNTIKHFWFHLIQQLNQCFNIKVNSNSTMVPGNKKKYIDINLHYIEVWRCGMMANEATSHQLLKDNG